MKFNEEKKKTIISYLLEKIDKGDTGITKTVSEVFSVNQNTIHTYINQLVEDQIIERVKRGQYKLVDRSYSYQLNRRAGDLDSDTYAFNNFLRQHIKDFPANVRAIWEYAFSEMINNVMDHSQTEIADITITQNYLNTTVAILDHGIGIFEKIRNHFGYDTLDDAICELFKGKLTTDSKNHSGEGIFFSSKMMDNFLIISSQRIFTNNKYDDSEIFDLESKNFPGTCVIMKLSNFTHRTPQEVFDAYADVDGGFTKTTIPLKNLFDAAPVSRSQAKRVCHRLERFEEVTLDFNGLEWMGQGFAHQLFVVFKQDHPDIKLIPINMNDNVTKMFTHVTTSV